MSRQICVVENTSEMNAWLHACGFHGRSPRLLRADSEPVAGSAAMYPSGWRQSLPPACRMRHDRYFGEECRGDKSAPSSIRIRAANRQQENTLSAVRPFTGRVHQRFISWVTTATSTSMPSGHPAEPIENAGFSRRRAAENSREHRGIGSRKPKNTAPLPNRNAAGVD